MNVQSKFNSSTNKYEVTIQLETTLHIDMRWVDENEYTLLHNEHDGDKHMMAADMAQDSLSEYLDSCPPLLEQLEITAVTCVRTYNGDKDTDKEVRMFPGLYGIKPTVSSRYNLNKGAYND